MSPARAPGEAEPGAHLHLVTLVCFVALPWLNPLAPGPEPGVVPWLVTLGSLALVLLWVLQADLAELVPIGWLVAALISALLGLLQYFGVSAAFEPWVNATAAGEAFANLRQRNQFATLTNIGLASLLWWVGQARALPALATDALQPLRQRLLRVGFCAAAVLLTLGNLASSSRTGLAQLVLLVGLTLMWGGWRQIERRRVLLAVLLAYGLAALFLSKLAGLDPHATGILARLHEGDSVCSSRLTLWSNVLHLIAQKPWAGWGWGELDYAHFITLYPGARFCDILDNAHNLPLHLAVELGLPFAVLVCGAAAWVVWRAKPWREQDANRQLAWSVLAVILLHSMLEYPLWYGPFQMAFGLSLWLLWRSGRKAMPQAGAGVFPVAAMRALLAMALFACAAYAAWDYHRISQIYLSPGQRSAAYRDDTLAKISGSWLFKDQVRFAQLITITLTLENARFVHDQAAALLHFSPEPRVIEMLIDSAKLLGLDAEATFYLLRYQAAFPQYVKQWAGRHAASASNAAD